MDSNQIDQDDTLKLLEELTLKDFMDVGLNQVAYIKRVETSEKDKHVFSVHAADGSQLSIRNSYDTAVDEIRGNDLYPVTVH